MKVKMSKKEFAEAQFSGSPLRHELMVKAESVVNSFVKRRNLKSGEIVLIHSAAAGIARQLGDWLNDKLFEMVEIEGE